MATRLNTPRCPCRRAVLRHGAAAFLLGWLLTMPDDVLTHELLPPSLPAPFQAAISAGPYNFEFTPNDRLRISVANSLVGVRVEAHYRVAGRDGRIQTTSQPFTPTTDRTVTTLDWPIGDGYLLNVTVIVASGAPKRGQTFVKLEAIRGGGFATTVLGTLVEGYVTGNQNIGWPGSPIESSTDGDGYARFVTGTDPGVFSEILESVPSGARWELLSVVATLVTNATAGNRLPNLGFDDGVTIYARAPMTATVGPSLSVPLYWQQGAWFNPAVVASTPIAPLPQRLILASGHRISTQTTNISAGDNWGAPLLGVREWLEV